MSRMSLAGDILELRAQLAALSAEIAALKGRR
jgi:hypothetical protein